MSKSPSSGASSPQRITQTFTGIAVLTLALGGGAVFWLNGQIHAAQAVSAGLAAQVGSSQQIARRLDDTQAAYKQTYDRISFLESAVTAKSFVPTLLQQLQTLATTTHLTVTSVHPAALTTPAAATPDKAADGSSSTKKAPSLPYDTMAVDLNLIGTYADTQTFLYDLTRFPKILSVNSVQMTPGGEGVLKGVPQVTTVLRLTAFVFHDDGTTTLAPPPGEAAPPPGQPASQSAVTPPTAAPTVAGAAGRAAQGAIAATHAADTHSAGTVSTL